MTATNASRIFCSICSAFIAGHISGVVARHVGPVAVLLRNRALWDSICDLHRMAMNENEDWFKETWLQKTSSSDLFSCFNDI